MRHRRRRRFGFGTYISVSALLAVVPALIFLAVRIDKAVRPVARMQALHFAELNADTVIEKAAADYLQKNELQYSDFAAVLYDSGKVVSVETIPYNINKVQSELGIAVNQKLSELENVSDKIPIGSLTDSYLLAGKGPKLKIRICPAGKASVAVKSEFESAGINQTRHRISAVVTADIASSLPLYSFESSVSFEFLLAETVIIGDVPELSPYTWNEK